MIHQVDISEARAFLHSIIKEQANSKELEWIGRQEKKLKEQFELRSFYLAFSTASRFVNKERLGLSKKQLVEADELRKGFQPESWNLLQCVRSYLLLMLPTNDPDSYQTNLTKLYEAADVDEQVTLYAVLPILPYPETMAKRAIEGLRTNITDVFDAIALNNPFAKDFLDQDAWNQMLLKAVFMQRPLYKIYGADERANPELARMLVDFAHERWAANRKVWPELWRFVGPFLNEAYLEDIEKVVKGDPLERKAGLLACSSSEMEEARQLVDQYPDIKKDIENDRLNWRMIGKENEDRL